MKNEDQEDEATMCPQTYEKPGEPPYVGGAVGLETGLRAGTAQQGLWIQQRSPDKRVNLLSPPLLASEDTQYTTHDKKLV